MPADLVVLSACQTALGRLAETEGVIGLSRALFIAGARTVVVSLWSVSDTATALLMEYFYGTLLAGKTVPEAMRTAQMKLKNRREYAHPFYWAGFVVIGAEA
jgi:CHAT domain-containing protein